jgi:hypothetical protein
MLPELITKAPPNEVMSTTSRRVRLIAAELAAAVTLLFSSLYTAAFYNPGLAPYTGRESELVPIFLSIVAFALCVRIRSPAVAGMLIAGGVIILIPPLQAIAQAGMIAVPGPIFGVISFADILVLGLVKAAGLRKRESLGAHAPEKVTTEPGIPSAARALANLLPDLSAFSPISASAAAVSLLGFSKLCDSRNSTSAELYLISGSRTSAGTA